MGVHVQAWPPCACAWTYDPLPGPVRQVSYPPEKTDDRHAFSQCLYQAIRGQTESRHGCRYLQATSRQKPSGCRAFDGCLSHQLSGMFLCFAPGMRRVQLSAQGQGRHLMLDPRTIIALALPWVLALLRVALKESLLRVCEGTRGGVLAQRGGCGRTGVDGYRQSSAV